MAFRGRTFECPVHEQFTLLDPCACALINTPECQRLKRLLQLGFTHHVFDSAEHSRFPHSMGVAFLAQQLVGAMRRNQPELDITAEDATCVTVAALAHDLGHGPFSHTFEKDFLRRIGISKSEWYHEAMSCKVLDLALARLPDSLAPSEDDVLRIKMMIDCKRRGEGSMALEGKRYLFDIVSNQRNGVDVDKFDYLPRDSLMCSRHISFDFRKAMNAFKVIGGEVCYPKSQYQNLHELFHSRELMHREVYTHPTVMSINLMVADALVHADKVLGISGMVHDPSQFVQLDDTLLQRIACPDARLLRALEPDLLPRLEAAQALIAAVERQELYVFVNEIKIPAEDAMRGHWQAPAPSDLVSLHPSGDVTLNLDDIVLAENEIDFSMDNHYPLDNVRFFDDWADTEARPIPKAQASHMITDTFQEHSLRLYCRNRDPSVCEAAEQAFKRWVHDRFGSRSVLQEGTPVKQRAGRQQASCSAATGSFPGTQVAPRFKRDEQCLTPTSSKKPRPL